MLSFRDILDIFKPQSSRQLEPLVRQHASLLNNCQQLKQNFLDNVTAYFELNFLIRTSIVGNWMISDCLWINFVLCFSELHHFCFVLPNGWRLSCVTTFYCGLAHRFVNSLQYFVSYVVDSFRDTWDIFKPQSSRQLEPLVRLHASLLNNCQQLKTKSESSVRNRQSLAQERSNVIAGNCPTSSRAA